MSRLLTRVLVADTTQYMKSAADVSRRIANECLAVRVRLLGRALSRIYDEALRPLGVSTAQMNILVAVEAIGGGVPQSRVSEVLSLEKSTLSRNVQRLVEQGHLQVLSAESERVRVLGLTPAGRRLLVQALPRWEEAQAEAEALLGDDGADALRRAAAPLFPAQP